MPATDLTLTAQWEAGKIGYTVKHYQQTVDGSGYELVSTVNGTADMDSNVTPEVNTYEGFTSPAATSITITADDMDPENFNSAEAILATVKRYQEAK